MAGRSDDLLLKVALTQVWGGLSEKALECAICRSRPAIQEREVLYSAFPLFEVECPRGCRSVPEDHDIERHPALAKDLVARVEGLIDRWNGFGAVHLKPAPNRGLDDDLPTEPPPELDCTPEETIEDKCTRIRSTLRTLEIEVRAFKEMPGFKPGFQVDSYPGQHGEMIAQSMLAVRAIEDARMRLGKVLQYAGDGTSIYEKT